MAEHHVATFQVEYEVVDEDALLDTVSLTVDRPSIAASISALRTTS